MSTFILIKSDDKWSYELRSDSGEKIIRSRETFPTKSAALASIAAIKRSATEPEVQRDAATIAKSIINTYSQDFHNLANR